MNLLLVSEKHGLLIIGVYHELYVYNFDPVQCTINNVKDFKKLPLYNDNVNY
jgi:hypothetical protein